MKIKLYILAILLCYFSMLSSLTCIFDAWMHKYPVWGTCPQATSAFLVFLQQHHLCEIASWINIIWKTPTKDNLKESSQDNMADAVKYPKQLTGVTQVDHLRGSCYPGTQQDDTFWYPNFIWRMIDLRRWSSTAILLGLRHLSPQSFPTCNIVFYC